VLLQPGRHLAAEALEAIGSALQDFPHALWIQVEIRMHEEVAEAAEASDLPTNDELRTPSRPSPERICS